MLNRQPISYSRYFLRELQTCLQPQTRPWYSVLLYLKICLRSWEFFLNHELDLCTSKGQFSYLPKKKKNSKIQVRSQLNFHTRIESRTFSNFQIAFYFINQLVHGGEFHDISCKREESILRNVIDKFQVNGRLLVDEK